MSASGTVNAHLQQSNVTVELARDVAEAAVAKVLMQMVLPVLLKMSKAAVRKTLQDKQVGIALCCVKQQLSMCCINTFLHGAVCSCASCKIELCGLQAKTARSLAVSASSVQDAINHIGQVSSQLSASRLLVIAMHSTKSVLHMSYMPCHFDHGKHRACSCCVLLTSIASGVQQSCIVSHCMQAMQLVELTSKMHRACQQFTKTIINSAELGIKPADFQQMRLILCANIAQQLLQFSPVTDLHQKLTRPFRQVTAVAGFR